MPYKERLQKESVREPGMPGDERYHISQVIKQTVRTSRHEYALSLWCRVLSGDRKYLRYYSHGPLARGRKSGRH